MLPANNNHNVLVLVAVAYSVCILFTMIMMLLFCVCNPKTKRRFSKHKSFILTHDFPTIDAESEDVTATPNTGHQQQQKQQNDNNKLKVKLRALPDIPQQQQPVIGNGVVQATATTTNNTGDVEADVQTDDVDPVYTSADNPVTVTVAAAVVAQPITATTTVAATTVVVVRHHHYHHQDEPHHYHEDNVDNHAYARIRNLITSSNDSSTENDTDDYSDPNTVITANANNSSYAHNIPLGQDHQDDSGRVVVVVVDGANDPGVGGTAVASTSGAISDGSKKEISYNTISVREPLAKVLAERNAAAAAADNNLEHHYNEVEEVDGDEEERISSFYEEISTGSVTYSKIEEPSTLEGTAADQRPSLPLYSFVQKRPKKNREVSGSDSEPPPPPPPPVVAIDEDTAAAENLYTKVTKPKKKMRDSSMPPLQRYSSKPPPLPPLHPMEPVGKMHRNTIHVFGHASSSFPVASHEQQVDEKDPGYETVYSDKHEEANQQPSPPLPQPEEQEQFDYGYEAILNDSAYEVVAAPTANNDSVDNGYETIKNHYVSESAATAPVQVSSSPPDDDDDESDPNYEIIANIKASNHSTPVPVPPAPPPNQNHPGCQHHHHHDQQQHHQIHYDSHSNTVTVNSDDNIVIIEHL